MTQLQSQSVVVDKRRSSIHTWQDRIRDPSLTVLLMLELCAIFIAVLLAAKGVPVAWVVGQTAALLALAIVVLLSRNGAAYRDLVGARRDRGERVSRRGLAS